MAPLEDQSLGRCLQSLGRWPRTIVAAARDDQSPGRWWRSQLLEMLALSRLSRNRPDVGVILDQ